MSIKTTKGLFRSVRGAVLASTVALLLPAAASSQQLPSTEQNEDQRAQLLHLFAGAVDAETMAREAAGPHWQAMSDSDRSRYVDLFRRHLVALVGDLLPQRLPETGGEPTSIKLPGGDTLARTSVTINGTQVPVGIRLREGDKIVDMVVDSASLMEVKRSEITSLAARGGVSAVIEALEQRSAGPAVDVPARRVASSPAIAAAPAAPTPEPFSAASRQVVYFPYGSAAIPPTARESLVELAQAATGPAFVSITGYADSTGSSDFNAALSRQRAEDVARTLVSVGVPPEKIRVQARGEAPPAAGPVPEAERRRVEVAVVPVTQAH